MAGFRAYVGHTPFWAAVAALPLAVLPARRDPLRTAYEAGSATAEVYLAGAVFSPVSEPLLLLSGDARSPVAPIVYGTLLAGATMVGTNHMANAGLLRPLLCNRSDQEFGEVAQRSAESGVEQLPTGVSCHFGRQTSQ